ncbi:MAG: DUF1828 domain-containing protein [Gemmatimonadaceae bacterium]
MSSIAEIERDFETKVCSGVRLLREGAGRFRVFTPFSFDDGDRLSVVLRGEDRQWMLSDEGNTYLRLSYRLDDRAIQAEGRQKIIENALNAGGVEDRNGELVAHVEQEQYGDALYSLVQAILRISDVALLTREQVRATFLQDVRTFIEDVIPPPLRVHKWHEPERDPAAHYPVDWMLRANGDGPIFVFALQTDDKVKDATITLHQFEKWDYKHRTIGIFQEQEEISRKVLARFTDVADKNFSAFEGNQDRIKKYLESTVLSGLLPGGHGEE